MSSKNGKKSAKKISLSVRPTARPTPKKPDAAPQAVNEKPRLKSAAETAETARPRDIVRTAAQTAEARAAGPATDAGRPLGLLERPALMGEAGIQERKASKREEIASSLDRLATAITSAKHDEEYFIRRAGEAQVRQLMLSKDRELALKDWSILNS